MRVTQTMINRTVLKSVEDSRENLNTIQNELTTSKKIQVASDDPVNFSRAVNYKNALANNEQYLENITNGSAWMDMSSSVLNEMYELTMEARGLALQGADDGSGAGQRETLADTVNALLDNAVTLGNSVFQDKYIFGGTITSGEDPFLQDSDGNVTYEGNSEAIKRRVYDNYDITINVAGDEILDSGIFSNIKALREALLADDGDAVAGLINDLNDSADQILATLSRLSSVQNQADMTQVRLETANINLSSYISDTEDADMAEAIARYGIEEMAYQSALQVTAKAINMNIMNYLE